MIPVYIEPHFPRFWKRFESVAIGDTVTVDDDTYEIYHVNYDEDHQIKAVHIRLPIPTV